MSTISPYWLKFQVSYVTLFRLPLRVAVHKYALCDGLAAPDKMPSLPNDAAAGTLLKSAPAAWQKADISSTHVMHVLAAYPRYYVDLRGGFGAFEASLSASTRSTIRRKVRKFSDISGGAIDFRTYRTESEMTQFFDLAQAVSAASYQERVLKSGLPSYAELADGISAMASQNAVRGYLLFHQGQPVSYLYCPSVDNALVYAYLGYLPAHAQHSPGAVLQWLVFEQLFAEQRFAYFDFTEGEAQHKSIYATGKVDCADILILPRTAGNRVLLACHGGFHKAIEATGAILARFGLRQKIRHLLRS
jgi:hypothetical protein